MKQPRLAAYDTILTQMAVLTDFHIQNVRCFRSAQNVPIRPITLLVGENSTGKTTFMGCYKVLNRLLQQTRVRPSTSPDFNEAPFAMGSFQDIVSAGKPGLKFFLGAQMKLDGDSGNCDVDFTFAANKSNPIVTGATFDFGTNEHLKVHYGYATNEGLRLTGPGFSLRVAIARLDEPYPSSLLNILEDLDHIIKLFSNNKQLKNKDNFRKMAAFVRRKFMSRRGKPSGGEGRNGMDYCKLAISKEVAAIPPIRSKPMRSYNTFAEDTTLLGEHLQLLQYPTHIAQERARQLLAYGRESHLFSKLKYKKAGTKASDPYQIHVKARGPTSNIADVGYGVNQILPIVANVAVASTGTQFLLQQPEVHLHPRGQAALASYFVEAYQRNQHSFMIETHSDYILDRFRIQVNKGLIRPEHVMILFFAPSGANVKIQPIELDVKGNLINASKKYRDFFMEETMDFLGFLEGQ